MAPWPHNSQSIIQIWSNFHRSSSLISITFSYISFARLHPVPSSRFLSIWTSFSDPSLIWDPKLLAPWCVKRCPTSWCVHGFFDETRKLVWGPEAMTLRLRQALIRWNSCSCSTVRKLGFVFCLICVATGCYQYCLVHSLYISNGNAQLKLVDPKDV